MPSTAPPQATTYGKENVMTDQTYWVVRLEALSFETREEADAFRDKMEDAVTALPEAESVMFASTLRERKNYD